MAPKNENTALTIDEMATFCRSKGIIYNNSDIYGGMKGFFDYGPLGSEIKKNLKDSWWKFHVHDREDIVGIDGSIITHPKVWQASGHVANFEDIMVEDVKTGEKHRADVLVEEALDVAADGLNADQLWKLIQDNNLKSPAGNDLSMPEQFNLMFKTQVGPKADTESTTYLRPETAQVIFTNFKNVAENSRMKLPFGIAQVGKAFRNEISPRNFLFRCREFEQMEIEYFIHPKKLNECPFIDEVMDHSFMIYDASMQENNDTSEKTEGKVMTVKEALDNGTIKTRWHAYWLATEHKWFISLGAKSENFRMRQHISTEKSHYALDTWDLEYKFPFGWKELQGMANRTDFDLQQHMKHSKKDLSLFDEESKEKVVPYVVAEPSQGVDRAFLVFMYDAYEDDKERGNIVLHLSPILAPYKVAVFPLMNKLKAEGREVFDTLKKDFPCQYDTSGSVGRRYARADEIGVPYCVTVDFEYKEKGTVTIRDRESTKQIVVEAKKVKTVLFGLLSGELEFEKAGTLKE